MAKYRMISRYGNAVKETDSERRRDDLIRLGYREYKAPEIKPLDEMTVPELEAYAKEKGIDLGCCTNKAEKLARIKAAEGCQ